jgi:outer membrane protein assembly factor BamB
VLVAAVALLPASSGRDSLAPLFEIEGGTDSLLTDGSNVFVALPHPDYTEVAAYRATDGHKLWSKSYGFETRLVTTGDGLLVLNTFRPQEIVAIDTSTGAVAWRLQQYSPVVASAPGLDVLVVGQTETPGTEPGMTGIDLRTGRTRWLSTEPMTATGTVSDFKGWADLDPDGTLRVFDIGTGAQVRSVKLDVSGRVQAFNVAGDLLIAYVAGDSGASVFDLTSGRRLWRVETAGRPEPLWPCGAALCHLTFQRPGSQGLAGLDPRTGQRLWWLDSWGFDQVSDRHLVVTLGTEQGPSVLVDSATGAVVQRLGRWRVLVEPGWPRFVVWQTDPYDRTTLFARVDGAAGTVTVFGRLTEVYEYPRCDAAGAVLVCAGTQRVSVWRYRL